MDPTIKQKLDGFAALVHGDIEAQNAALKEASDTAATTEIADKKEQLRAAADTFYKQRLAQTKDAMQEALSSAQIDNKHAVLDMRKAVLKETIEALEARAGQFVGESRYRDFIMAQLASIEAQLKGSEQLIVSANQADCDWLKAYFLERCQVGEVDFKKLHQAEIGGLIVELPAAHVRYNMTLKSLIDGSIDQIGAKLYALFEEMEN